MTIAVRQSDDGTWRLLEQMETGKWRAFERDLEDEDLAERIAELIEDGDVDPNEEMLVIRDDSRSMVPARSLCTPESLARVGFVLGANAPTGGIRPSGGR